MICITKVGGGATPNGVKVYIAPQVIAKIKKIFPSLWVKNKKNLDI